MPRKFDAAPGSSPLAGLVAGPPRSDAAPDRMRYLLVGLMVVQGVCAAIFPSDVARGVSLLGRGYFSDWHNGFELAASVSLVIGIALGGWFLAQVLRRHARTMRGLGIASGALHDLMEDCFRSWELTPAEADVAAFAVKVLSIAAVADLRDRAKARSGPI